MTKIEKFSPVEVRTTFGTYAGTLTRDYPGSCGDVQISTPSAPRGYYELSASHVIAIRRAR